MFVVGLFKELGPEIDSQAPSLKDSLYGISESDAVAVSAYLESIPPVIDVLWNPIDPIDGRTFVDSAPSICTDGLWIWRFDLNYYVKNTELFCLLNSLIVFVMIKLSRLRGSI